MSNMGRLSDDIVIRVDDIEVRYSVREPSPNRWNAIGLITGIQPSRAPGMSTSSSMIVGVGGTPDAAIKDMIGRIRRGDHPDLAPTAIASRSTGDVDFGPASIEQAQEAVANG